ncbi:MAG: metal ABC transporter permease [Deltaproteobacteria bacterium]|nr:metal ABC transporter permease [Deltaproteobacteria bacterium]
MQATHIILPLIVAVFVAAGASLLGSFAILKRMSLVGDALSHVAMPGIALALIFKLNPFIGAVVFLFIAVIGIWIIEYRSALSLDTIVGVFFTASLALGALIMPEHDLIETLFGNITSLSVAESVVSIVLSLTLIAVIFALHRKLALNMVSQDIAQSIGIRNKRLEFIFLLSFALAVALGIRFVGALLMGSLVIIPAASAKNVARSLMSFMLGSMAFGMFAAATGIFVAYRYALTPGPVFIIISTLIFITTIMIRQFREA